MPRSKRTKRILNVLPSRDTDTDWRLAHAARAGLLAAAPPKVPTKVDLREPWWKIGDQGETGSCVGWATGEGLLRWHLVKTGRLGKDEPLSPRFIWMASKETDEDDTAPTTFIESAGTTLKAALDIARHYGAVRDKVLPFASGKLFVGEAETFYAVAAELKLASYFNISLDRDQTLDDWRNWIATKGPILVRLDVDRTWDEAKQNKGKLKTYKPATARGGHAVSLVGYTPDHFIVRNSWGTTEWGDKGFGYASHAYTEAAFTEAYGISV